MQSFESLLEQSKHGQLSVDASWGQGRTLFGGLSSALGLERTKLVLADQLLASQIKGTSEDQVLTQRPLRSIAVNFSGQCLAESNMVFQESLLSHGKSISQINAQVLQNDRIVTQVSACYGIERESSIEVASPSLKLPKLGSHPRLNYLKGLTPEFVQHFEFEYSQGQFPFSNSEKNELAGWMRFKESGQSFTDSHLLALIDAWPPTVLQKLKSPAPCASVSWNLEIVQPLALLKTPLKSDTWLYYEAKIKQAHHGYAHTEASIYSPEGILLALSRQLIAIYA